MEITAKSVAEFKKRWERMWGMAHDHTLKDGRALRLKEASLRIEDAMQDKDFREHILQKQKDAIHTKGWSKKKDLKDCIEIPFDAYEILPEDMKGKDGVKNLKKWLKSNHPYLLIK